MNICLVNDYSPDYIGGAFTSLLEQKNALEKAGHTVIVLQLGNQNPDRTFNDTGFIYIKPTFVLPSSLYNLPVIAITKKSRLFVKQLLIDHHIDVVHAQSELTLPRLAGWAARELNIPLFFTVHTFFWQFENPAVARLLAPIVRLALQQLFKQKLVRETPDGNAMEQLLKNMTLTFAQQSAVVISPSQHQKKAMIAAGLTKPCHVLPNPFDGSTNISKPTIVSPKKAIRFVWIGRFAVEKRPLEFLQAVKQAAKKTQRPFIVDMIGEGELLATARQKFSLKQVNYLGRLSHQSTVKTIDQSDIVCSTSYHYDNQPMIIAEAISRYRPVFYCDERLTEGVDQAGFLAKSETVDDMAQAIIELVEHPETISHLSKRAQKTAHIFTPQTFAKRIESIYRS